MHINDSSRFWVGLREMLALHRVSRLGGHCPRGVEEFYLELDAIEKVPSCAVGLAVKSAYLAAYPASSRLSGMLHFG